jgi:transcriptional regulator with GAF, ATPase, and Fis domain
LTQVIEGMNGILSRRDLFAILASRLRDLIPFDGMAVYARCGATLVPEYAAGAHAEILSSVEIRVGEGLSGWVARNSRAILNGNPAVDLGEAVGLKSALAIPLQIDRNITGVLTIFHAKADAFSTADLQHLTVVGPNLAISPRSEQDTQSWAGPDRQPHPVSVVPSLPAKQTLISVA